MEVVSQDEDNLTLQEGQQVQVGFKDHFGFHKLTPEELLSPFLGTMVSVEGIITKCSLVRPKEVLENSAPGQLPRLVVIIVEDDLVDTCKPGDRVAVVRIQKAIPNKSKGSVNGLFRTVIVANNVSHLNKEINTPIFTSDDIKNIEKIGNR
ncbi:hypothetical protein SUGI_0734990 [Cryptomeria japonica]|nr:hypothetical protein SUGI_0734990 [Cryptomeria japonica]